MNRCEIVYGASFSMEGASDEERAHTFVRLPEDTPDADLESLLEDWTSQGWSEQATGFALTALGTDGTREAVAVYPTRECAERALRLVQSPGLGEGYTRYEIRHVARFDEESVPVDGIGDDEREELIDNHQVHGAIFEGVCWELVGFRRDEPETIGCYADRETAERVLQGIQQPPDLGEDLQTLQEIKVALDLWPHWKTSMAPALAQSLETVIRRISKKLGLW